METTFRVDGMTCGGCASSLKKALERLGVEVEVSLPDHTAKVSGTFDDARIKEAVEAAGYVFGGRVG